MSNEKRAKGHHWRYGLQQSYRSRAVPNQFCQYTDGWTGKVCLAETGGKTYCEKCEERRNKGPVGRRYMQYWRVG